MLHSFVPPTFIEEVEDIFNGTADRSRMVDTVTEYFLTNGRRDKVVWRDVTERAQQLPFSHQVRAGILLDGMDKYMRELNGKNGYETMQERMILMEDARLGLVHGRMHTPSIVQHDGTVAFAMQGRLGLRTTIGFGKFFNLDDRLVRVSLEELDEAGDTVRDPQVLRALPREIGAQARYETVPTSYASNFPGRRPTL